MAPIGARTARRRARLAAAVAAAVAAAAYLNTLPAQFTFDDSFAVVSTECSMLQCLQLQGKTTCPRVEKASLVSQALAHDARRTLVKRNACSSI